MSLVSEIEAPAVPRARRASYSRSYSEYAQTYDSSERTIKGWVKCGKDKSDLPPLDDPVQMPVWWNANMKQRVPGNILDAASKVASTRATPLDAVELPQNSGPIGNTSFGVPVNSQTQGFLSVLRAKREQVEIAYNTLRAAQIEVPSDPAKVEIASRSWSKLAKELQDAEMKAPDLAAKEGRYIDKALLEQELTGMLSSAADAFRSLYRKLKPKLDQAQDESEADEIWQVGVDETFGELYRSGYAQPFSLAS